MLINSILCVIRCKLTNGDEEEEEIYHYMMKLICMMYQCIIET